MIGLANSFRRFATLLAIAWRYRCTVHQGLYGLINRVATLGLALGVAALIIGLSAMNGFELALQQRILALVPHGEVLSRQRNHFKVWQPLAQQLQALPEIRAVTPILQSVGLLEKGRRFKALLLRGVDADAEAQAVPWPQHIRPEIAWQQFSLGGARLLLGKSLAEDLGLQVGEWVQLSLPREASFQGWRHARKLPVQLVGLLQVGSQLDHCMALLPLNFLQQQLRVKQTISHLALYFYSIWQAEAIVQQQVIPNLPTTLTAQSWLDQYGHLHRDIQMVRSMIDLALILVISIACLNITTSLLLTLKRKQRDLAILSTLGATPRQLSQILLNYGLLNGLIGGGCGMLLGVCLAQQLTSLVRGLERLLNCPLLASQLYFIDFLPTQVRWSQCLQVFGYALLLSLLASGYPAYRARKNDPVTVLQAED